MRNVRGKKLHLNRSAVRQVAAWIASVALILQVALPYQGGFLHTQTPFAHASSNTWDFTGTYTPGSSSSNEYAVNNAAVAGGYAQSLLKWSQPATAYGGSVSKLITARAETVYRLDEVGARPTTSTDFGATWDTTVGACVEPPVVYKDIISVMTGNRVVVSGALSGASDIRYKAFDSGCYIAPTTQPGGTAAWRLSQDTGNTIFVGTGAVSARIYSSTDDGVNWAAYGNAVSGASTVFKAINIPGKFLYAATNTGIYYSSDNGTNWTASDLSFSVANIEMDTAGYMWARTATGLIYKSTATAGSAGGAISYSAVTTTGLAGIVQTIYPDPTTGHMYAGTTSGIFRLLSGASAWLKMENSSLASQPSSVYTKVGAVVRFSGGGLLIGGYTGSLGQTSRGLFFDDSATTADLPYVTSTVNSAVTFTALSAFSVTRHANHSSDAPRFQISHDGTHWYYYKIPTGWTEATSDNPSFTQSSIESDVNLHIGTYMSELSIASGTFYFRMIMLDLAPPQTYPITDGEAIDSLSLTYTDNTPSITVTAPNGSESWGVGTTQNVTWNVNPATGTKVRVSYSANSSGGPFTTIATQSSTTSPYGWTIGNLTLLATYRIKLELLDNSDVVLASDISNADFAITYGDLDHFSVNAPPSALINQNFNTQVVAQDVYNNTIVNFANGGGSSTVSFNPGPGTPATVNNNTFINGVVNITNTKITAVGDHLITVTYSAKSGSDSILIDSGGGGSEKDTTLPVSHVRDLEPNQENGAFGVYAHADDELHGSGIQTVQLWYRKSTSPTYTYYGDGIYRPGYLGFDDIYSWNFSTTNTGGDGLYYFYSRAIDGAGNLETAPTTYDTYTYVDARSPWVEATNPYDGETNVGVNTTLDIYFSEELKRDAGSLEFTITPDPDGGISYAWEPQNPADPSVLKITPRTEWDPNTTYTVNITKVRDLGGHGLNSSRGVGNPFTFTTAPPQDPDLTTSVKMVNDLIAQPGERLYYTITLTNRGHSRATVNVKDYLPTTKDAEGNPVNLDYANYAFDASPQATKYSADPNGMETLEWNHIVVNAGQSRNLTFSVWLKDSLPHLAKIVNWVDINDGINPLITRKAVTLIGSEANFDSSSKSVNMAYAYPGDTLTYTLRIKNTGDEDAMDVNMVDVVPVHATYVPDSVTGGGIYDEGTKHIMWSGEVDAGTERVITYKITIDADTPDTMINNTMTINWNGNAWDRTALTMVDDNIPPTPPTQIIDIVPSYGTIGVGLYAPIVITFNNPVDPKKFNYTISSLGEDVDTTDFINTWSDDQRVVTITHPTTPFYRGLHEITVSGFDANGDAIVPGAILNPSEFTTVQPKLVFVTPAVPLTYLKAGIASQAIQVKLVDETTGADYSIESAEGVNFDLLTSTTTGDFDLSAAGHFDGSVKSIHLGLGVNNATFYYKDGAISAPNYISIAVAENPALGWIDAQTFFVITKEEEKPKGDAIYFTNAQQSILVNTLSDPLIMEFRDKDGKALTQPAGTQFIFNTTSDHGYFYEMTPEGERLLQFYVPSGKVQAQNSISQVINLSQATSSLTVYYKDLESNVSPYLLSVSAPTTSLQGGSQPITVRDLETEDKKKFKLEDLLLDPVEDDTGRELAQVEISPDSLVLFAGDSANFEARAIDTEGNVIENAKFGWFVINGGGQILKNGLNGQSNQSVFTAGLQKGEFDKTILVATLYNGKLQAAVATVSVVDLNDFNGGKLPSTGINGLQMLFFAIAILAGIALAWVESYEKQHFGG
jgi:uncharacterized repeat protein (TIGR01451 family)